MRGYSYIFTLLVTVLSVEPSQAQGVRLLLQYPGYEEFSFKREIQSTLGHGPFDDYRLNSGILHPSTIGCELQVSLDSAFYYLNGLIYYHDFGGSGRIGQATFRRHWTFGIGRLTALKDWERSSLRLATDLVGRFGIEDYLVSRGGDIFPTRRLRDFGIGLGPDYQYELTNRIFLSFRIQYVRWLFLFPNQIETDRYPPIHRKSGNEVVFKLSIGFKINQ